MSARTSVGVAALLHERGRSTWEAVHAHPMIEEIGRGTIATATFRFYFEQNVMYLEEYARSLAFLASRSPDSAAMAVLLDLVSQIVDREIPANLDFLGRLGGTHPGDSLTQMTGVNYSYTRHLLYTATQESVVAGLCAVLPCQWSYAEIATRLATRAPDDAVCADWIAMFANPAYDALVGASVDLLDRLAKKEGASVNHLAPYFDRSSLYELAFWQMAYTRGADDTPNSLSFDAGQRSTDQ